MIENIRVIGASRALGPLRRKRGGGEIHGPEHQTGGGEIDGAAVDNAEDFSTIQDYVAQGHRHAKPRNAGEAAGASDVVEASAGIEVVAAAGASADGGTPAVATVGESVAAEADDYGRVHGKTHVAFSS